MNFYASKVLIDSRLYRWKWNLKKWRGQKSNFKLTGANHFYFSGFIYKKKNVSIGAGRQRDSNLNNIVV